MQHTEQARPLSVLFVCTANICRSAFAHQLTQHLLDQQAPGDANIQVASAGTHGWIEHPVEKHMAAELAARGVEADGFASRPLTMTMVDEADLVLTAAMAHRQFILDDRPGAVWRTFTLGQFARIVRALPDDLSGRELVKACRKAHKPASPSDDIADPFGRGAEAAAQAAQEIDDLLRQVVPRLHSG